MGGGPLLAPLLPSFTHLTGFIISHCLKRGKMEFFNLSASLEFGVLNSLIGTFENLQRKNNRPPYYLNSCPALLGGGLGFTIAQSLSADYAGALLKSRWSGNAV